MSDKETEKKQSFTDVLSSILIYCLIFAIALGFNDVAVTLFNKLPIGQSIFGKMTYILVLFFVTISIGYYAHVNINPL